jgi:hypothetical protein
MTLEVRVIIVIRNGINMDAHAPYNTWQIHVCSQSHRTMLRAWEAVEAADVHTRGLKLPCSSTEL